MTFTENRIYEAIFPDCLFLSATKCITFTHFIPKNITKSTLVTPVTWKNGSNLIMNLQTKVGRLGIDPGKLFILKSVKPKLKH